MRTSRQSVKPLDRRILVTGGAGFIGSAIVAALNKRGITDILITDNLGTDEKWRNLINLKFADYIEADVFRNRLQIDADSFGKFSSIFHLGACSSTTEKNASFLADNNYAYTKELASFALSSGARFIYASSASTYGDGSNGMSDTDDNLHRLVPLNMYGYSKHLFDLFAQRQGWLNKIVGLKYFNVFGPNEYHKGDMRSLVFKAFIQIRESGKISLFKSYNPKFGDGQQMRDFLYVKDAAEMSVHFAETAIDSAGLFNLGSGKANTWCSLANAIFESMSLPKNIVYIDMPEMLRDKYQYYTRADTSKLQTTGYNKPVTDLHNAVHDYVQNYLIPGRYLEGHAQ